MASLILNRMDLDVTVRGTIATKHVSYSLFEPNIRKAIAALGCATFVDGEVAVEVTPLVSKVVPVRGVPTTTQ